MQLHYKKEPAVPKTKVKKHPVKSEFKRSVWACVRSEPEEKTAVWLNKASSFASSILLHYYVRFMAAYL